MEGQKEYTMIREAIASEQDFSIDLMEFELGGLINDYYATKKLPQRITFHWVHGENPQPNTIPVLQIELRGYVQAVFIPGANQLYKVAALPLQWKLIQRAFNTIYGEVKSYE